MKIFSYIIIAIVAISVVAGFFIIGSPAEERLRQADQQRIYNLQDIQGQIVYYWQSKNQLPTNLDALTDSLSGWRAPRDPKTGESYIYETTGELGFNLCATFDSEGSGTSDVYYEPIAKPLVLGDDNWQHPAGDHCFARTIDPDLYPPLREIK